MGFGLIQPLANSVITGQQDYHVWGVPTNSRGDVVLCSRRVAVPDPTLLCGYALGVVSILECVEVVESGYRSWKWVFENPRAFGTPFKVKVTSPFFVVKVPEGERHLLVDPVPVVLKEKRRRGRGDRGEGQLGSEFVAS